MIISHSQIDTSSLIRRDIVITPGGTTIQTWICTIATNYSANVAYFDVILWQMHRIFVVNQHNISYP